MANNDTKHTDHQRIPAVSSTAAHRGGPAAESCTAVNGVMLPKRRAVRFRWAGFGIKLDGVYAAAEAVADEPCGLVVPFGVVDGVLERAGGRVVVLRAHQAVGVERFDLRRPLLGVGWLY
jgi:hypothetical protein